MENQQRQGVTTAIIAALSEQKDHLKRRSLKSPPSLELEEIKSQLEDEEVGNEVVYLRDAGVVSTNTFPDGRIEVELNPSLGQEASDVKEILYEEFEGDLQRISASSGHVDFEAPDGWPEWEGPDLNEEADRGVVSYERKLGPLCAIMSVYGEERLRGADITEYSVEAMEKTFKIGDYELGIDIEENLDILDQLGYVERHATGANDVYRLADDERVKRDAEAIAEFRDEIFSGHPQNMALAYEEADRRELEDKGVKLVQRAEKQVQ